MKLLEQNRIHSRSGKWLKKARRRYIRLIAASIEKDHSKLWTFAENMKKRGVYAEATFARDVRFYVLRGMFRLSGGQYGNTDWNKWLLKNGWGHRWWDSTMTQVKECA
jgi:hypothetical protein